MADMEQNLSLAHFRDATISILLWYASRRYLGDTPLHDIVAYHISAEPCFVLTYLIKIP